MVGLVTKALPVKTSVALVGETLGVALANIAYLNVVVGAGLDTLRSNVTDDVLGELNACNEGTVNVETWDCVNVPK
ncbi:hypothetical protein GCM10027511_26160 [Hymenobacter humi]